MGPEASAPSSCDVVGGENSNGHATQPVFKVNRNNKNGETLELTLSSLSPLFAQQLCNAAEELGTSTSSLKKACRFFGLERWPGRKVRGLESTIDGLERALVGRGDDSEVAGMRSEIHELQQELDELCHGTPEQITEKMKCATVITKNAYRRLYYAHGWRSKHHNPTNTGNLPNLTSGLAPPSACENSLGANKAAEAKKQRKRRQNPQPPPYQPSPRKYLRPRPRRFMRASTRMGCRESELKVSDLEGLLPEVHYFTNVADAGREVPESAVQAQNGSNMFTPATQIGEDGAGDGKGAPEDEGARTESRCPGCGKMNLQGNAYDPALVKVEGSMV